MKTILVTGGAGFLGSHTCLLLLQNEFNLIVLDSFVNSSEIVFERLNKIYKFPKEQLKIYKGDIRDNQCLINIFESALRNFSKIDGVIHFAGLKSVSESVSDPLTYWEVNVNGSINLFKVMKNYGCNLILFSSSATIYDPSQSFPVSESGKIKPTNPYGKTKFSVEEILITLYNSDPNFWKIGILRYFNPVGAHPSGLIGEHPKDKPNNLMPYISQVAVGKRKFLNIFGKNWPTRDGTGIRDYIHVMDLAEGHLQTLKHLIQRESKVIKLNLGSGRGYSVLEIINNFESINNCSIPFKFVERRNGDVPVTLAKIDLAKKIINWYPKKNIIDMCRDSWKWQRENPNGYS